MYLIVENMDIDSMSQAPILRGLSEDEIPVLIRWVDAVSLCHFCDLN